MFITCSEVIQISKDNMSQVMEIVRHGPLKGGSEIIKAKRHDLIGEGSPWTNKRSLKLINMTDTNLVVLKESIHKG